MSSQNNKPNDSHAEEQAPPSGRQVVVLLDKAALETVKTKKGDFQLLNCDDHVHLMAVLSWLLEFCARKERHWTLWASNTKSALCAKMRVIAILEV